MTGKKELFKNLRKHEEIRIEGIGGIMRSEGKGDVEIKQRGTKGEKIKLELKDAIYVPGMKQGLISIGLLMKEGYKILFEGNSAKINLGKEEIELPVRQNLFETREKAFLAQEKSLTHWHKKFG